MGRLRGTPAPDATAPCRLTKDKLGGEKAQFVERVLDVRQGELCWVVGTVYMDLSLKPNVLADISKEVCFCMH
jgi:DNA polymerase delta subunit 2